MNRGFTLIELLGVIIILSLLMMLLVPNVLEQINNKKGDINETQEEIIKAAAELYVEQHPNENIECVCINTLQTEGMIADNISEVLNENSFENIGVKMDGRNSVGFEECC